MFLLQSSTNSSIQLVLILGTLVMILLIGSLVGLVIFHQRKVIRYQLRMQAMKEEQQRILLTASIHSQEEERQRLAADLHDDAGPLLATARLYLNENLVNLDKSTQLQSIFQVRQILDDTIQLIRNISHSLMPPTLKNFGLESAVNDLLQKINSSGTVSATSRFHDYKERMRAEKELNIFRVLQELVNNILKHSNASFIHLIQNVQGDKFVIRMHHDGRGLDQSDFERLNRSAKGLGLKNITSRMQVANGRIVFEKDTHQSFYKITIEVPVDDPYGF
jgi:two-component system, NarL family, sensor kinase